jgi:uncharacterized phosphosugar-binding protein
MSAQKYFQAVDGLLRKIQATQLEEISKAGRLFAGCIEKGGWVYLFGSGHSVIPALDVYPRYGSFVGFRPLMDPRLMWFNVIGPGGAPELLWLERQEGYVKNFLRNWDFSSNDAFVVYSHGGMNAAPIEAAIYVREHGTRVVAVTSVANQEMNRPKHSSGRSLKDVADIVIDNCVPPEDSLVDVGQPERVGAGSTFAVVAISMALVAETAACLRRRGHHLETFVSPNVPGIGPDHNERVFNTYRQRCFRSK